MRIKPNVLVLTRVHLADSVGACTRGGVAAREGGVGDVGAVLSDSGATGGDDDHAANTKT